MKRPGWDATRRSRNIGTIKQGRGRDSRLVIPQRWSDDRVYWEKLVKPVCVQRKVGCLTFTFLVEPPRQGFIHSCTIDDVARMLGMIPTDDLAGLELLIFRQPKQKECILEPVWGRLGYWVNAGRHSGPGILIEAQCPSRPLKWAKSLTPDKARELDRLRHDGHKVTLDKRHWVIASTVDTIRSTQLYRTLVHEIGHYVNYLPDKPQKEKEDFAHQYADRIRSDLGSRGLIPFPRILDRESTLSADLKTEWFADI